MNYIEILDYVSTVGFPIVMCIIMYKYVSKHDEKRALDSKEIKESVASNTEIMKQLVEEIDKM